MRPRTVPWWDRLLIRLPAYLLLAWTGCYGMFQNGWVPFSSSVLIFFAAALPLLAGWQLLRVFLEHRARRVWEAEHATTPNQLGLPDPAEVAAQLAAINASYPRVLPMAPPKHGVPLALLAAVGIIGAGAGAAWLAWWLGAGRFTAPVAIAVVLALLAPWPNNIIRRRIIRNYGGLQLQAQKIQLRVDEQRYAPSGSRDTGAADSALQLAAQANRAMESFAAADRHDAAAASLDVLADISRRCFAADSRLAKTIAGAQRRCHAAQAELMQKPSLLA